MSIPVLRDYQETAVEAIRASIRAGHRSPLLVSPTGSGKTILFSYMVSRHVRAAQCRAVILVHREELIEQVSTALRSFNVHVGLISAGAHYDRGYRAHVASVQTLVRRLDTVAAPTLLIVDEAHHGAKGSSWATVIAHWRKENPAMITLGVTATPERLDGKGLSDAFDDLVVGPSARQLIDAGHLAPYRVFAPPAPDMSSLHMRGGDYARNEAAALIDKPTITGDAVEHYRRHVNGAPAFAFCVSIAHAEHVADAFRSAGFRAQSVDGTMDKTVRRAIIKDFRDGRLNVLTSCDLIGEGLDVPGAHAAMLLRPTASLGLCMQQIGRILRPCEGKTHAIILDHVGNIRRHGLPDAEREWSLDGREERQRREGATPGTDSVRTCPECFAVSPSYSTTCRECGQPFPIKARKVEAVEGELLEMSPSEIEAARAKRHAAQEQGMADNLEKLTQLGRMRGMKDPAGWARHVLQARQKKMRAAR